MLKLLFLLPMLWLFGCTTHQEKLGEVLQSHGATTLRRDFKKISEYLVTYKEKLDLRNPKAFSKESAYTITQAILNSHNTLRITHDGIALKTYDDYLRIAFSKNPKIPDRNDFLIVGLHKLLYETYQIEKGHQITTLAYQQEAFKKLGLEVSLLAKRKDPPIDFNDGSPKILTYHQAKGLTFDIVFMPRLDLKAFRSNNKDEILVELFVGCSRAVEWVCLSSYQKTNGEFDWIGPIAKLLKENKSLELIQEVVP